MRNHIFILLCMVLAISIGIGLTGCGGGGGGGGSATNPEVAKYAGTYIGLWTATSGGYDNGTFTMTIANSGVGSGSGVSAVYGTTGTGVGSVDAMGNTQLVIGTTSNGSVFTGTIDSKGNFSGTWTRSINGYAGTFNGQRKEGAVISTGVIYKHRITASDTGLGNAGVTVTTIGLTPEISTITDVNGYFTLSSVPKSTPFTVKFSKPLYTDLYTAQLSLSSDTDNSNSPYSMMLSTAFTNTFSSGPGTGVIASYVRNSSDSSPIVGAVVTATDMSNPTTTYPVYYLSNQGIWDTTLTSTASSGKWMVKNIPSGKTVKITASKIDFTFNTRMFDVKADSLSQNTINGTATSSGIITISVSPATANLKSGDNTTFSANVTGTSNTAVTWSVQESGGGTITSSGVYTAPSTAGTYHVKAVSVVDTTKSATATVTVNIIQLKINLTGTLSASTAIAAAQFVLTLPANVTPATVVNTSDASGSVIQSGLFTPGITGANYSPATNTMNIAVFNAGVTGITQTGEIATVTLKLIAGTVPTVADFPIVVVAVIDPNGNYISGINASVTLQ